MLHNIAVRSIGLVFVYISTVTAYYKLLTHIMSLGVSLNMTVTGRLNATWFFLCRIRRFIILNSCFYIISACCTKCQPKITSFYIYWILFISNYVSISIALMQVSYTKMRHILPFLRIIDACIQQNTLFKITFNQFFLYVIR